MKLKLLVIVFSLFFFIDPLIFSRVFINNDIVAMGFVLMLFAIIFFHMLPISRFRLLSSKWRNLLGFFLLYAFISSMLRVVLGQPFTYLVQHLLFLLQVILLFTLFANRRYHSMLVNAYLIAAVIHVITLVPGFSFISQRLSETTAYFEGEYDTGIFTRRGTGFFSSSGQLSIFAIGGLGLALMQIRAGRNLKGILLMMVTLMLGVGSLSRSFFLVGGMLILFFIITADLKSKLKTLSFILVLMIILLNNSTVVEYGEFISDRFMLIFKEGVNDRMEGETGLPESLQVVGNYPLFGYPILNENALWAWNGEIGVRPHNGLVAVLSFYGFVLGFPVLNLVFLSFRVAFREFRIFMGNILKKNRRPDNLFLLGFSAVNIICLVEPLVETTIYFFFLFGLLQFYKLRFPFRVRMKAGWTPSVRASVPGPGQRDNYPGGDLLPEAGRI